MSLQTVRDAFWAWFRRTKCLRMDTLNVMYGLRYSGDMERAYRAGFREAQRRYLDKELKK